MITWFGRAIVSLMRYSPPRCLLTVVAVVGVSAVVACRKPSPQQQQVAVSPPSPPATTEVVSADEYWSLIRMIGDENPYDHLALRNAGAEFFRERNLASQLQDVLKASTADRRHRILEGIGYTKDQRLLPTLIDLLKDGDLEGWTNDALTKMGADTVPQLFAAMQDPALDPVQFAAPASKRTLQRALMNVIEHIGSPALPFLQAQLGDERPADRRKALQVLGWMTPSTLRAGDWSTHMSRLEAALAAPDAITRIGAWNVLYRLDDADALRAHFLAMKKDPDPTVASLMPSGPDDRLAERRQCQKLPTQLKSILDKQGISGAEEWLQDVRSRKHLGDDCDREFANYFARVLSDSRVAVRTFAVNTLCNMWVYQAHDILRRHFADEHEFGLRTAIIRCGALDTAHSWRAALAGADDRERVEVINAAPLTHDTAVIGDLTPFLDGVNPSFEAACLALNRLGDTRAVPALIAALKKRPADDPLRGQLLTTMFAIGGKAATAFAIDLVTADAEPGARAGALEGLRPLVALIREVREFRKAVQPALDRAVKDSSPTVRQAVIPFLDVTGLVAFVNTDVDATVRIVAFNALGDRCTVDAARALSTLLAGNDPEWRNRTLVAMANLHVCPDPDVVAIVRERSADQLMSVVEKGIPLDAQYAAHALATAKYEPGVSLIIRRFESRPEERVGLGLALGSYGPMAKAAKPVLEKAREGATGELLDVIRQSLGQIH